MPNEQPQASRSADTFTLPEFPEVEMQGGDLLRPDGHEVARILKSHTAHTANARGAKMLWQWMRTIGYSRRETISAMAKFGVTALQSPTPNDRGIFRPANIATQRMIRACVDRSMAPESRLIGAENIARFMEANRSGVKSALFCNHTSELDPVFVQTHMQRLQRTETDPRIAAAAQELDDGLTPVVGHKVLLDRFRRVFAGVIQSICTVSPKYRAQLQQEEKHLVQLYTNNGTALTNHLMQNPAHTIMIFPQGGMTRGNQIAFQGVIGPTSKNVNILPAFIQGPEGMLRPDVGENICYGPANVDLYIGEPFAPHTRSTEALVLQFRDRLRAVGANVEEFQWGYMHRKRDGGNLEEEFVEL